jgi:hypothetical protein
MVNTILKRERELQLGRGRDGDREKEGEIVKMCDEIERVCGEVRQREKERETENKLKRKRESEGEEEIGRRIEIESDLDPLILRSLSQPVPQLSLPLLSHRRDGERERKLWMGK